MVSSSPIRPHAPRLRPALLLLPCNSVLEKTRLREAHPQGGPTTGWLGFFFHKKLGFPFPFVFLDGHIQSLDTFYCHSESVSAMAWTNNAQQPPYQYDPHEGGAYLTAIGTGLAIESPIRSVPPNRYML